MNVVGLKKINNFKELTLERYLTSDNKYPFRANSPECTDEVKNNAKILISKLNQLFRELNLKDCEISSGYRTSDANKAAGGAIKSKHMTGNACDIKDLDGSLKKLVNEEILIKYGLYCEIFEYTKTWVHFQDISPKSGNRFFIP